MLFRSLNALRIYSKSFISTTPRIFSQSDLPELQKTLEADDDCIILDKNPYAKEKKKCILCEHNIELDYKNARLLQQFVSSFSGRVYDKHVTGLCDHQHKRLIEMITISRRAGYMPIFVKDPRYLKDPKLFNAFKPIRSHSYA
ncbi:28S ribosomal protein S18c, mitochondrial [Strongyloides ratti]|uniref:28S ribosomal protein S18c, mitochondrial n=1 Tax=Strongyloides ratti TaxID=34506 RepID=A0A090MWS3_STRRB|nr:28S ribosomal protein S18c, mitochondrial [Strongyloides ratti]CEF64184.1 28S ribosomal protein S18c, mitochondrial [Strongyloides ratti]